MITTSAQLRDDVSARCPSEMPEGLPRRFTFAEYLAMAESGILKKDERTELIEGQINVMLPVGHPHHRCVLKFVRKLHDHLPGDQWAIISQVTVEFENGIAPEPDICIARGTPGAFDERYPTIDECAYVIEVSESSLHYDRGKKLSLYAKLGISHYWIVNLIDRTIEAYSEPDHLDPDSKQIYKCRVIHKEHDSITMCFPGESDLVFTVAEILPKFSSGRNQS